jgi:hypothetical protein
MRLISILNIFSFVTNGTYNQGSKSANFFSERSGGAVLAKNSGEIALKKK